MTGVKTIPWGPSVWSAMHYIALGYPDQPTHAERTSYETFYNLIPDVLPCTMCRTHFQELLKSDPVEMSAKNGTTLFNWTVRVHNRVNERLGKPQLSNVDAISKYIGTGASEKQAEANIKSKSYNIFIIAAIATVATVLIFKVISARTFAR